MVKLELTSQKRSELRAAAHPLKPVVLLGEKGLTDAVLKEIDANLTAHELIKVKAGGQEREARTEMVDAICNTLNCALVHHLGKTLILYRPQVDKTQSHPEIMTRAVRKPTEPYTPKKKAAQGESLSHPSAKPAAPKAGLSPKARRSAKPAAPARGPHNIPRRSGSALTLRAGARRGLSGAKR